MFNLLIVFGVVSLVFGAAVVLMSVGLMLRGKIMRGGCGSHGSAGGGCEVCSKKAVNLCDEGDQASLAGPAFAATMGRYQRRQASGKRKAPPNG